MIDSVISAFAKIATGELSKRHIITLIVLFLVFVGSVILYESYTSNFRLSRLDKATRLLHELVDLRPLVQADEQMKSTYSALVSALDDITGSVQPAVHKHSWLLRLLGGFWLWYLFGVAISKSTPKDNNARYGIWIMGLLVAVVCSFLPESRWPWYHFIVYPLGSIIGIVSLILISVSSAANKKPKPINE